MKSITFFLIITVVLFSGSCSPRNETIIGVKIYEYQGDYRALADRWQRTGINTAFVSVTLAANDTFRQALRTHHIPVYVIFPVFQAPEVLERDSTLYAITGSGSRAKDDWVEFVCPSREAYRQAKIAELAAIMHTMHPDGISIDFIRQFVFWEMVYPDREPESIDRACFCDSCLAQFSAQTGMIMPDTCFTTRQKAGYVTARYAGEYDSFRCDLITSMVRELAETARSLHPGIRINVHAVPWRTGDFGGANVRVAAQDLEKIAPFTDFISPMCYSQMLKRDAAWIGSVVSDMDKRSPGKILPSIQVYPYYIDRPFSGEDLRGCIREALKPPSRGVVFWSWPLLEQDEGRVRVVEEEVRN